MNAATYLETKDGAKICYQERGQGRPLILVHGWLCSSRFWQKNVPELAREFRVVTFDLRGHGNSSKILAGHTIRQYARDVREVVERLGLQDAVLVGWSLGGSVVLSYRQQYAHDSCLKALAVVDSCPFPFSPAEWNNHTLRDYNLNRMHATFAALIADPRKFAADFTYRMFRETPADADRDWVVAEMMKVPAWIGESIYSDFVTCDLARTLPEIEIPLLVCSADSGVFPQGIAMGKALAALAPRGKFIPFQDAGHMLFYEQPQKFNAELAGFIRAL